MFKKIYLFLLIAIVVMQFILPAKNDSDDNTFHIATKYKMNNDVQHILKDACYDCHSNKTEYPWYAKTQPIAWILNMHITEGKKHLNFSEFTNRPIAVQYHKFEEVVEMVEEKEMPLASYTYFGLHPKAKITDEQRSILISWAKEQMDTMKVTFPADSLIRKKRK